MIRQFLKLESAGGILLMVATALALLVANSPLAGLYENFLDTPVQVRVGRLDIAKPLLLWINDGLMAVFFLLVGLELKRELLEGELAKKGQLILPAAAAVGGMVVPVAVFAWFNWGDAVAMRGWAIPAATDIAFALGLLTLLGSRVPTSLKIFLVSLAILDDIGAIVIIAVFYTGNLSTSALIFAGVIIAWLAVLNRRGTTTLTPYILLGTVLWIAVLKSGVHATLAGVVLAFFIPLRAKNEHGGSPLHDLEHSLHGSVAYVILPLFAFANAGIGFSDLTLESLTAPLAAGISMGLFAGKQIGIFLASALVIGLGLTQLPRGVNWGQLYGVSVLCGVGFTMSLFIGGLAFDEVGLGGVAEDRLGILVGSALSMILGLLILRFAGSRDEIAETGRAERSN